MRDHWRNGRRRINCLVVHVRRKRSFPRSRYFLPDNLTFFDVTLPRASGSEESPQTVLDSVLKYALALGDALMAISEINQKYN